MEKKTLSVIVFFTLLVTVAFAKPDGLSKVKNTGILTVGVKGDVQNFCKLNPATNEYEGLEADIARAIAKKLFNNESKVKFVVVTEKNRSAFLNQDRIDMIIANISATEDLKKKFDFSETYYTEKSYSVAIRKDNTAVTKFVNDVIRNLNKTGELNKLIGKNGLSG